MLLRLRVVASRLDAKLRKLVAKSPDQVRWMYGLLLSGMAFAIQRTTNKHT